MLHGQFGDRLRASDDWKFGCEGSFGYVFFLLTKTFASIKGWAVRSHPQGHELALIEVRLRSSASKGWSSI